MSVRLHQHLASKAFVLGVTFPFYVHIWTDLLSVVSVNTNHQSRELTKDGTFNHVREIFTITEK